MQSLQAEEMRRRMHRRDEHDVYGMRGKMHPRLGAVQGRVLERQAKHVMRSQMHRRGGQQAGVSVWGGVCAYHACVQRNVQCACTKAVRRWVHSGKRHVLCVR